MNIVINHPSETGNKRVKVLRGVKSIVYDYGFELDKLHSPAIKILSSAPIYHLVGVHKPEELVKELQITKKDIELDIAIFDPNLLPLEAAIKLMRHLSLRRYFLELFVQEPFQPQRYGSKDAFLPFLISELYRVGRYEFGPIAFKNTQKLAELWGATMPTFYKPKNVSKFQYFYALLDQFRYFYMPNGDVLL